MGQATLLISSKLDCFGSFPRTKVLPALCFESRADQTSLIPLGGEEFDFSFSNFTCQNLIRNRGRIAGQRS